MGVSRVINRRTAVLGLLLVILATAGFGFAASNSVPESRAGDGEGVISGFTITNISYSVNTTDPSMLSEVSFTVNGGTVVPGDVWVTLVDGSTTWDDCTASSGATMPANFTCAVNVAVLAADELRVVAAQ